MRGGRYENERLGNTKDMGLHHVLGAVHSFVGVKVKAGDDTGINSGNAL